jgi:hypothetical protein
MIFYATKYFAKHWQNAYAKTVKKLIGPALIGTIKQRHADMARHRYHIVTNSMIFRHTILLLLPPLSKR